jgi:hypothetical protein
MSNEKLTEAVQALIEAAEDAEGGAPSLMSKSTASIVC